MEIKSKGCIVNPSNIDLNTHFLDIQVLQTVRKVQQWAQQFNGALTLQTLGLGYTVVLNARTPEGNASLVKEASILQITFHEERIDAIHLGASYSRVLSQIGRVDGHGILIYPTPATVTVLQAP